MKNPSEATFQLLSIIGPTASGKTDLALFLAEEVLRSDSFEGVDLLSADSRQVYQGLEVVTGADIPPGFEQKKADGFQFPFFEKGAVRLHGVAIVQPDQEWSVAHFRTFAQALIKQAWTANRLPILVGGTGLYHAHAISTDPLLTVPPNEKLREKAADKTLAELQQWLRQVDAQVFEQMTPSDQKNPRRIIRALEKTQARPQLKKIDFPQNIDHLTVGLKVTPLAIDQKIKERVRQRFEQGGLDEVSKLTFRFPDRTDQALSIFTATGVAQLRGFLKGKLTKDEAIAEWSLKELQYAKRQMTWFKKHSPDAWIEADSTDRNARASELLNSWLG